MVDFSQSWVRRVADRSTGRPNILLLLDLAVRVCE